MTSASEDGFVGFVVTCYLLGVRKLFFFLIIKEDLDLRLIKKKCLNMSTLGFWRMRMDI